MRHAAPVGIQLVGGHERQRRADAGAHLRPVRDDEDGAVGFDAEIDAGMQRRALRASPESSTSCAHSDSGSTCDATTNAPVESAPPRNRRRLTFSRIGASGLIGRLLAGRRRGLDRGADALIGAAPADVARHGAVDVRVGRIRRARQQRGRLHDLAALAVAALRDVVLGPGALHRVAAVGAQPLDGHDLLALQRPHRRLTRADGLAVDDARCRRRTGRRRSRTACRSAASRRGDARAAASPSSPSKLWLTPFTENVTNAMLLTDVVC